MEKLSKWGIRPIIRKLLCKNINARWHFVTNYLETSLFSRGKVNSPVQIEHSFG